jgi:hypothetical protein
VRPLLLLLLLLLLVVVVVVGVPQAERLIRHSHP